MTAADLPFDPKYQCTANSKQSGERCRRRAIPGGTVCKMHGGRAPQTVKAAERRVVTERVKAEVGQLVDEAMSHLSGLSEADQLVQAIGYAGAMSTAYRWLLDALPVDATWQWQETRGPQGATDRQVLVERAGLIGPDHQGNMRLHVVEEGFRYWTKLHATLVKDALALGLDERRTRVFEFQAQELAEVLGEAMRDLGMADVPDVMAVVARRMRMRAEPA